MSRAVVAVAFLVALSPVVEAEPVLFDNTSATFPWTPSYYILKGAPEPEAIPTGQELDLTLPPTQPGTPGDPFEPGDDHRFAYLKVVWSDPVVGGIYNADQLGHGLDSRFAIGDFIGIETIAGPIGFWLPRAFEVGETVGPSEAYLDQVSPLLAVSTSVAGQVLPHGDEVFLGVRFTLLHDEADPTTHYGWIQMVATTFEAEGEEFLSRFEPLRWAYETIPETPILVDPALAPACPPDLTNDGTVDSNDLNILLAALGTGPSGDVDGDNDTDSADLNILLAAFAIACP